MEESKKFEQLAGVATEAAMSFPWGFIRAYRETNHKLILPILGFHFMGLLSS